jgi:cytochrome c oxidase subunit 2
MSIAQAARTGCVVALTVFALGVHGGATDSIRTVDVVLSQYAFAPERIEARVGEPLRLNVVSVDGTHGFQVKALGLKVKVPGGGKPVTIELTPRQAGTFRIGCSEYCGSGHSRMQAWLIVNPAS